VTRRELLEFMRSHSLVVQTSVSTANAPQAAVVGAVVTDAFEIAFDTLASTRKAANLRFNPRIAFVIGVSRVGRAHELSWSHQSYGVGGNALPYQQLQLTGAERPGLRSAAVAFNCECAACCPQLKVGR